MYNEYYFMDNIMTLIKPFSFQDHIQFMEQDHDYFYHNQKAILESIECSRGSQDRLNFLNFIYLSPCDKDVKHDFIHEAISGNYIDVTVWHQYNNIDFLNEHISSFYHDTDYQYFFDYIRNDYIHDLRNIIDINNHHPDLKILFNEYNCIHAGYDNDIFLLATFHALTHDTLDTIIDLFKQLPFSFLHSPIRQKNISFNAYNASPGLNSNPLIINILLNDYYAFAPLNNSFLPILTKMILSEIEKEKAININKNSFLAFLFLHMEINNYLNKFMSSINQNIIVDKEQPEDIVNKETILFIADALFNTVKNSNSFNDYHTTLTTDFSYNDLRQFTWAINQIKQRYHASFKGDYHDLYDKTEYLINIQYEKESLSLLTNNNSQHKNIKRI